MYKINDLCSGDSISPTGWEEISRIAKMRAIKHYPNFATADFIQQVTLECAEFLLKIARNARSGACDEPSNVCAVLSSYARCAASNAYYKLYFRPLRDRAVAALSIHYRQGRSND